MDSTADLPELHLPISPKFDARDEWATGNPLGISSTETQLSDSVEPLIWLAALLGSANFHRSYSGETWSPTHILAEWGFPSPHVSPPLLYAWPGTAVLLGELTPFETLNSGGERARTKKTALEQYE